jgi:hypothetical protein
MPDFPTTPVDGDTHVIATSTWKYYSTTDRWEIEDTSGVPQSVSTLLETLTWTAGDATVTSSPIVYSDYSTITITYAGIHAFSSSAITAFQVKNSPTGTANEIRSYGVGDHQSQMSGTSTILTATGTSNSNTTINSVTTDVQNLSFIGPDYSTLIFGWGGTGIFASGGSIEIRGTSLQIQPNTLAHLDDVNATVPTDGQVLTWDNTNSYWKPAAPASGGSSAVEFISYSGVINNASTVDFTGFDDSKYVSYFFELNDVRHDQTGAVSPPAILYLSLATSGTTYDKTDGNYVYGGTIDSHGFKLVTGFTNQNMGATGQFKIYNPHVTAYTMGHNEVAASYQPGSGPSQPDNIYGGFIDNINAKQMYLNTGSITAAQFWVGNDDNTANYSISSGEIRMYGLRKN